MVSFFQRRGFSRPSLPAIVLQILWATALILCLTTTAVAQEGFTFVTFDVPGAAKTLYVRGINNAGAIIGNYQDQAGFFHSFLLKDGVQISFDVPNATQTNASSINASGTIVGTYADQTYALHGFLLHDGIYTTIDVPGATGTQATAINASGEIVTAATQLWISAVPPFKRLAGSMRPARSSAITLQDPPHTASCGMAPATR